jgi:hypothetical protein
MNIDKRAAAFSLALTMVLFLTGLASVPWANQYGPMVQNLFYALGRLPIVYVLVLVFWGHEK